MKKNQKCIDMLNETLKAANENEEFIVVCLLSRTSPSDFKLGRIAAYDVDDIIEILEAGEEIKDLAKNGKISESLVKDILNREKEKENKPREKFENPTFFCRKFTLDNSNTECLTQCETCKNYDQAKNQHGESQETNSNTGANAGTNTGANTGTNAGTDTGANTGTDTGANTGTDT